ncbi:MAG: hypothetical protein ACJ0OL_04050 [Dehalococcoidia bacterium]
MMNISTQIELNIPEPLLIACKRLGAIAKARNEALYLIGGVVRDSLLGVKSEDIDLVLDGDIESFSSDPQVQSLATIVRRSQFMTLKLLVEESTIDVANARTEVYEKPGSLPIVSAAHLSEDLKRRDFSINALAVSLDPLEFGLLVDELGGLLDIQNRILRGLHEKTFQDDPTRIIRAAIYKSRLGLEIDDKTASWINRDFTSIDYVSKNRIYQEIVRVLEEPYPELILEQLDTWGVTQLLPQPFSYTPVVANIFEALRNDTLAKNDLPKFYELALRLNQNRDSKIDSTNDKMNSLEKNVMLGCFQLLDEIKRDPSLKPLASMKPSEVFNYFKSHNIESLVLVRCFVNNPVFSQITNTYIETYSKVNINLNGTDIINLGVNPGPRIGELLLILKSLKLDGDMKTRLEEETYVKANLTKFNQ